MNNLVNLAKITLLGVFSFSTPHLFAQGQADKQEQKTFKIHIEKDENGNKEVIDRTFASKGELDAYMKENKMEAPKETAEIEIEETLTAPPSPPTPPNAPAPPATKQKMTKRITKVVETKATKRILISEKEESTTGQEPATIKLEITGENLTPEDRARIIQQLLDLKGFEIKIVESKK